MTKKREEFETKLYAVYDMLDPSKKSSAAAKESLSAMDDAQFEHYLVHENVFKDFIMPEEWLVK